MHIYDWGSACHVLADSLQRWATRPLLECRMCRGWQECKAESCALDCWKGMRSWTQSLLHGRKQIVQYTRHVNHTRVSMNWPSVLYHAARQRQKVQEIQDVSATEPSSAQYPAMSLYNIKHVMLTLNGWYKFDSCADFIVLRSHSAQDSLQMHLTSPCLLDGDVCTYSKYYYYSSLVVQCVWACMLTPVPAIGCGHSHISVIWSRHSHEGLFGVRGFEIDTAPADTLPTGTVNIHGSNMLCKNGRGRDNSWNC